MKRTLLALLASVALCGTASAQPAPALESSALPYRNPVLSVEQRAADLVARMTLEEKARQVGHTAPAIPRLGVPEYNWWNEGLHGVARAGIATVFPQAIGMAASWDAPLMQDVADTISTEFRAKYVERVKPDGGTEFYRGLTVWSPNINIFRDPRWGRGQETYGEDPHLTSRIGIAFIKGLQGNDPRYFKTIATSKHYAVHSGPESSRHKDDIHPSAHDIEDTYLPAFRATVTEANVQSVMCAYNAVYGIPACASEMLMEQKLRRDWGFNGYVVTDCGGAANIFRKDSLHYVPTAEQGVAIGFKAGMDLICGDYRNNLSTEPEGIVNAVRQGLLPEAVLDRALRRLFEARVRLGMFDPPASLPWAKITAADNDTPAHRALALKMAQASMVLLKNENDLLPIKGEPKTIAVIGPNADSVDALIGNYYPTPSAPVTVLEGIRARYPNSRIIHAEGTGLVGPASLPVPESALSGLVAEHFAGDNLEGQAVSRGPEKSPTIEWRGERQSSVRFTGTLTAPETGEYAFRWQSDNGYRIWVGDKLIVDEWGVGDAPAITSGSIRLEKGRTYPIRVEGFQRGVLGRQRLIWSTPSQTGDDAIAAARQADLVIFAGGLTARVEGEEMRVQAAGFAGGDRTSLDLPAPQQRLLERIKGIGKPLVLVLMNGSALSVNWADANVPAIVEAWYPGQEGGHAVAKLLAGDFSPAGRLPVTFYKSADQLPPFTDYAMKGRTYRYFDGEPLYPFGHGLSYTRFGYANARASGANVQAGGNLTVSVDVTNSGAMDGDEVVQLYLQHPGAAGAPIRALKGFERIHLKKGETRTVTFALDSRALSIVDPAGVRKVVPGKVEIWVGGGQPVSRPGLAKPAGTATAITITGEVKIPS